MKRLSKIFVIGFMAVMFVACGNESSEVAGESDTAQTLEVSDLAETEGSTLDETLSSDTQNQAASNEYESAPDASVDLDLTALSSTYVYAEIYNIVMEPLAYVGQTVKMEGSCSIYVDEETGKQYYACLIQDATQCCAQGLEFVLNENEYSSGDYPEPGEEIVLKGTFDTYDENGNQYLTLTDATFIHLCSQMQ